MLRNLSWLAAANLLVKPLWFAFITAGCMRMLGPEAYGVFAAALSLMTVVALLGDLGTSEQTVREVSRNRDSASLHLSTVLVLRLVLAAVMVSVGLLAGLLMGYHGNELVALAFAGLYGVALRLAEFSRAFLRAFERLRDEAVLTLLERLIVISCGIIGLLFYPTPHGVLMWMSAGMMVTFLLSLTWVHVRYARLSGDRILLRTLGAFTARSLPTGISGLASVLLFTHGAVLLLQMAGPLETGYYAASGRIVEAMLLLPYVVVAGLLPRLSTLHQAQQYEAFSSLMRRALWISVLVSAAFTIAITFAAPAFIHLLAPSQDFSKSVPVLRIVVWASPIVTACYLFNVATVAAGTMKHLAFLQIGCALVGIAVTALLIPPFKAVGAAVGLVVGFGALLAACIWHYRHDLQRTIHAARHTNTWPPSDAALALDSMP